MKLLLNPSHKQFWDFAPHSTVSDIEWNLHVPNIFAQKYVLKFFRVIHKIGIAVNKSTCISCYNMLFSHTT